MAVRLVNIGKNSSRAEALRAIDNIKNPYKSPVYIPSSYEMKNIRNAMAHKKWKSNGK